MCKRRSLKLATRDILVYIEEKVLNEISNHQKCGCFELEYGGIIVGYYDYEKKAFKITDITWPQADDICRRFRFVRKERGHQELMDDFWVHSGYVKSYLGEWHTHNQNKPSPSFVDRNNWITISKRAHNYKEQFFIIVGKEHSGIWTVKEKKIQKIGEWDDNEMST